MTPGELTDLRKRLGVTQTQIAEILGMSHRAYQEIENGRTPIRGIHRYAIDRASLEIAAKRGDLMLATPGVRRDLLALIDALQGKRP